MGRISEAVQLLTQVEYDEDDFPIAEALAKRLGYEQTAYTSTSTLWGLFCLPESPETVRGRRCTKCQDRPGYDGLGRPCKHCRGDGWITPPRPWLQTRGGCIIKTRELGLLFVQNLEDLHARDLEQGDRRG